MPGAGVQHEVGRCADVVGRGVLDERDTVCEAPGDGLVVGAFDVGTVVVDAGAARTRRGGQDPEQQPAPAAAQVQYGCWLPGGELGGDPGSSFLG